MGTLNDDPIPLLRETVADLVAVCTDAALLDLICKLLITNPAV